MRFFIDNVGDGDDNLDQASIVKNNRIYKEAEKTINNLVGTVENVKISARKKEKKLYNRNWKLLQENNSLKRQLDSQRRRSSRPQLKLNQEKNKDSPITGLKKKIANSNLPVNLQSRVVCVIVFFFCQTNCSKLIL